MNAIFADTFYWIAITDTNDAYHEAALKAWETFAAPTLVTTDKVLDEYLAYFASARPALRAKAGRFAFALLRHPSVRVQEQSRTSFLSGLTLYLQRPDKGYSLTDCISMETMRHENLTTALTNDRHFEQEGFQALFRS